MRNFAKRFSGKCSFSQNFGNKFSRICTNDFSENFCELRKRKCSFPACDKKALLPSPIHCHGYSCLIIVLPRPHHLSLPSLSAHPLNYNSFPQLKKAFYTLLIKSFCNSYVDSSVRGLINLVVLFRMTGFQDFCLYKTGRNKFHLLSKTIAYNLK